MEKKQMIRRTCEVMVSLAIKLEGNFIPNLFEPSPGSNIFEDLVFVLNELGVHEPHIEFFFEEMNSSNDHEDFVSWINLCVANPGPEEI
jgi:hypothetical protein